MTDECLLMPADSTGHSIGDYISESGESNMPHRALERTLHSSWRWEPLV